MYATIASILSVCVLVPQVFAGVFITAPVLGSTGQGGQSMTITWKDDGAPPSLADIGPCEFGIFAGSVQQQTELQPINPSVDVSKQATLAFNVNPAIGPNSPAYFIRITSLALKDPKNPQFPYEAFSAKFTLSNMSGQFSPAVQAQINGATSAAPGATTPSTPASTLSTSNQITTASAKATTSASASAAKAAPSSAALATRSNAGVMGGVCVVAALGLFL